MAFYKNKTGQKVQVYAWDTVNAVPKTGNAASITSYISKDAGSATQSNDVNPTELDATNMKGIYTFDLTQAESNCDLFAMSPVSATTGITLEPLIIFTEPEVRDSNVAQISNDSTAADNLELALENGTAGYIASDVKYISGDLTAADNLELALENGTAGYIASDVKYLNGSAQSVIDLKDFADDGYDPSTNKVQGVVTTDTATSVSNVVSANVTQISGDSAAADNLEADYDGTGYIKANSTIGTVTTITNVVSANVTQISSDTTAADNLELALENGTAGYIASDMKYLNGSSQSAIDLKDFADDGYDPTNNVIFSNVTQISSDATAADNLELALENGTAGYIASDLKYLNGSSQSAIDLKDFADDGYDPTNNVVFSNVTQISSDATAADNLELALENGTAGYMASDIKYISGDSTAADNLELALENGTAGYMASDMKYISGNSTAADRLEDGAKAVIYGRVYEAPNTATSLSVKDLTNTAANLNILDVLKNAVVVFTSGVAQGQRVQITGSNAAATEPYTLSVSNMANYANIAANDTFIIT